LNCYVESQPILENSCWQGKHECGAAVRASGLTDKDLSPILEKKVRFHARPDDFNQILY
jgi:hypothetical protein